MTWTLTLGTIFVASAAIPVAVGMFTYRKQARAMKILFLLIAIIALVEGYTLYQALHNNDYEWIHFVYMPVEYGLFALIFYYWQDNKWIKQILLWSIFAFAIICLANALALHNFSRTNSFVASVACSLYVPITTYTLYNLQKNTSGAILKDPRFWVSSALLLYSAGALSYFAFMELLPDRLIIIAWYFHGALGILTNLLYAEGFICQFRH